MLLDRIVEANSPTIVAAYEKRVAQLERSKFALEEQRVKAGQRPGTFEELFELAFQFLANPSKLWGLGKLEYRKLVLRLTFADRLAWCPNEGFRTPKTTLPFNMLGGPVMGMCGMAEEKGYGPNRLSGTLVTEKYC